MRYGTIRWRHRVDADADGAMPAVAAAVLLTDGALVVSVCQTAAAGKGDTKVECALLTVSEYPFRADVSDAELERAADEMALSYTYQTSAYYPCCQ